MKKQKKAVQKKDNVTRDQKPVESNNNNLENPYILATVSALAGILVYVIITLAIGKFEIYSTIILAIILWLGNFLSRKFLRRKAKPCSCCN
jgi:hypothetical protein